MKIQLTEILRLAVGTAFAATLANAALIITPTFDATISGDSNAAAIEGVINTAISAYESTFTNNITVGIYFQEGGGLGQSNTVSYGNTYNSFYAGLVANNANPAAIAGLNANGGNANTNGGVDPVIGNANISLKSADGRALGLNDAAACIPTATGLGTSGGNIPNDCTISTGAGAVDAIVSLNTAITNPGSPGAAGNYPLLATTEHEIDEVLGLGSTLSNCDSTKAGTGCTAGLSYNTRGSSVAPEDLFRYNSAGARTLGTVCSSTPFNTPGGTPNAFFSYGPATGQIAQFNNDCNAGDFGDWQSSPLPAGTSGQVQDAFTGPGVGATLGASEIAALSAVGYNVAVTVTDTPEPGTLALLGAGLAAFALYRRRRSA